MTVTLDARVRAADGHAHGLLVLIHGRGADEHDLAPLADVLDPDRRLLCALPRGPLALPPGGAHWYVVERVGHPDPATFLTGARALAAFVEELRAQHGISPQRTVVGGFSQGCVMTYAIGLGAGQPTLGGLLALSGFLPEVDGWPLDLERKGLEILAAHGTLDPIIDISFARAARDRLQASAVDLDYHETPVPHTIDPRIVPLARALVQRATT